MSWLTSDTCFILPIMQYFKKPTVNSLHNVWDAFLGVKLCYASGNSLRLPLSDTAPLANPISRSLMKCFMSVNVMFYVVHAQPRISTAPQLLLLVSLLEIKGRLKPLQMDPSERWGGSAWLAGTARSSVWAEKSPGNIIRWRVQGESHAAAISLV